VFADIAGYPSFDLATQGVGIGFTGGYIAAQDEEAAFLGDRGETVLPLLDQDSVFAVVNIPAEFFDKEVFEPAFLQTSTNCPPIQSHPSLLVFRFFIDRLVE
jgi:hypothetical protein